MFYYSRFKFIQDLMPLLQNAEDQGQDAKIITVLSAGNGKAVDVKNLGFKNKYSLLDSGMQTLSYLDLMNDVRLPSMFLYCWNSGLTYLSFSVIRRPPPKHDLHPRTPRRRPHQSSTH
jgi:hypothetical protein